MGPCGLPFGIQVLGEEWPILSFGMTEIELGLTTCTTISRGTIVDAANPDSIETWVFLNAVRVVVVLVSIVILVVTVILPDPNPLCTGHACAREEQ